VRLAPLLERFATSSSLAGVAAELAAEGRVEVGGLIEGARPPLIAFLGGQTGRSLLVITGHPHRAEHLAQELEAWLRVPVDAFPCFETLPYERGSLDSDTLARRQAVVNRVQREPLAVVTSMRALLQPVSVAPRDKTLSLRSGERIEVDTLLGALVATGYESVGMVEGPGSFARRGGILDVFPVGASHPLRMELLGDEIESLRIFDPVSQRSLDRLESVEVPPLGVLDEGRLQAALEELAGLPAGDLSPAAAEWWTGCLEALRTGTMDDPQLFAPYLWGSTTLLDAFEEPPLAALEDPADLWTLAGELTDQAREFQADLVRRGDLPEGLRPALVSHAEIASRVDGMPVVRLTPGGDERSVAGRVFVRPPAYAGRIREFLHGLDPVAAQPEGEASAGASPDRALVITSYQHARLAEILQGEGLVVEIVEALTRPPDPGQIIIVKGSVAEGWSAPDLDIDLYTDHEIFGWSKPRGVARRRRAARDTFFSPFTPGDYIVHVEHGIGQLTGVTRMSDERGEREYLVVQYAGSDRLYVPTDQLDRVTRYVGVGDAKPQLNRLGGAEWARAKARAKKAAEDMAEELIALYAEREAMGGHAFLPDSPWQRELEGSFPFEETPDQMQAIEDVKSDMQEAKPMDRLVVADVGYGKTEVAVRAAFKAVIEGMQAAVLVPTTVLAQQHMETFRERLEAFPVRVDMLSRFRSPAEQRVILQRLKDGELDVVIGTHRLLGKDVQFKNLGLLVIDEEQRFGVRHKEKLKKLRASVDVLTLTATPIPRTLHMSLTGIRDVSIIQTPPEGRLPIRTYLQPYEDRLIREAIVRELEREGQVYFVHNRVSGIEAVAQKLRRLVPEARVLVGHGQMPENQLEKVMLDFSHQKADVLLCSTIIESGLDIANVNTIVIDHAESLGLAQLYQLRGRVGRGVNQAYAYLLYPRDARIGKDAMRRMEAVFEATELGAGFQIAMADLEIRGAGNLLGAEQSGNVAAIGFDLYTDLLRDAIDRMRGRKPVERPHVTVDLPFDVLIPPTYVPDERERLGLYRRLAALETAVDVPAVEAELRDRFGPPPPSVRNLLKQIDLKFRAEAAGVSSVVLRGRTLVIKGQPRILFDRAGLYRRFGMDARVDQNVLRVEAEALGEDWTSAIADILDETAAFAARLAAEPAAAAT